MLFAAARYAYPNARVRALRSRRLTAQDRHFLIAARDLPSFLQYLATTSYGPAVPGLEGETPEPVTFERQLARPLMEDYARVARSLRGRREREIILALFSRFEAENLKVLLGVFLSGIERRAVLQLLYPLGGLSTLPWDDLWASQEVTRVADLLARTPFGRLFRHAIPQFEAQGRLFPLEMALELSCFRRLQQALSGLRSRSDRRSARRILGAYVDLLNISWVIRLRVHYGLSPEEIVNYSLPGGSMTTLSVLLRLARASDIPSFLGQMPPVLRKKVGEIRDWEAMRAPLETWFMQVIARVFLGPPFHIGVEIAYLLEKEMELTELVTLLEAKAHGLSAEEASERLGRPAEITYV
jgi:V/A-type H+-transporting ATPase subunit C